MSVWPEGVARVPDEPWTREPIARLARDYDAVAAHGWYANLDPTVEEVAAFVREGHTLVDYSGGTGIFLARLIEATGPRPFAAIDVDSSPKFLALALAKLRDEPRVAFRLLRWLKDEKRLQRLDEALEAPLRERGIDALVSTNAVHLYADLQATVGAWARLLNAGGRVFVQSGNILHPGAPSGAWIIDDTVEAVAREAERIVRADASFARHRGALVDRARLNAHAAYRRRVFLPPRPLATYLDALQGAGLELVDVRVRTVTARADEWLAFLRAYADAIVGWIGGTEKVEGTSPYSADLDDRARLLGLALDGVLHGRDRFDAAWTYVTARKP